MPVNNPLCPYCGQTCEFQDWNETHKYGYCNITFYEWKIVEQSDAKIH